MDNEAIAIVSVSGSLHSGVLRCAHIDCISTYSWGYRGEYPRYYDWLANQAHACVHDDTSVV